MTAPRYSHAASLPDNLQRSGARRRVFGIPELASRRDAPSWPASPGAERTSQWAICYPIFFAGQSVMECSETSPGASLECPRARTVLPFGPDTRSLERGGLRDSTIDSPSTIWSRGAETLPIGAKKPPQQPLLPRPRRDPENLVRVCRFRIEPTCQNGSRPGRPIGGGSTRDEPSNPRRRPTLATCVGLW